MLPSRYIAEYVFHSSDQIFAAVLLQISPHSYKFRSLRHTCTDFLPHPQLFRITNKVMLGMRLLNAYCQTVSSGTSPRGSGALAIVN